MKSKVVALVFSHQRLSEDTLWGELRRTLSHVKKHVEDEGFVLARVMAVSNNSDRSALLFIPEFASLPPLQQRVGPTVDRKEDSEAFVKTNTGRAKLIWVDDEARMRILQEREHTDLLDFLTEMAKSGAKGVGTSAPMGRALARSGKVLTGGLLTRVAASTPWLREGLERIASDTIGTGAA